MQALKTHARCNGAKQLRFDVSFLAAAAAQSYTVAFLIEQSVSKTKRDS
jgi:hypothetical protein